MQNIKYSVNSENSDKLDNETNIYQNPLTIGKGIDSFVELNTIHQFYQRAMERPNAPFLGERLRDKKGNLQKKYTWYTNEQIFKEAEKFGTGMKKLDLIESINEWQNMEFQFVGFYSINTVRLLTADIGCGIYNYCIIPLYDTLGEESMELAFQQTKLKTLLVSFKNIEKIISWKNKGLFKTLQNLVILDSQEISDDIVSKYGDCGLRFIRYEDVVDAGETVDEWAVVRPDTIYAFSYTSGTTGDSKGAMLSHQNIATIASNVKHRMVIDHKDTYVSYLPMPHVLERCVVNSLIYLQARIGFYSGDPLKLPEDMQILKPTIFVSVPRIFNKMYDKMTEKINKSIARKIVNSAVEKKIKTMKKNNSKKNFLYDTIFLNKAKKSLGGKVRVILTGSAPISEKILDFLKVVFQCPVLEGYGQTEGCSFQFMTHKDDPFAGHVGGPVPHNEFKLVDVPDLDYFSTDKDQNGNLRPRGEIWVRGRNIIPGYYLLDEKNKETFTDDGWLKTGDIAELILPEGRLKIIDRKKNIFKLSQGEYIAPEKLENYYIKAVEDMGDIFVYGNSLKSCLVAIVNFTPENLKKYAEKHGIHEQPLEKNKELKQLILKDIEKVRVEQNFNSLEKIRDLIINVENWEQQNLLTTTLKKKRHELTKYFKNDIDELYTNLDQLLKYIYLKKVFNKLFITNIIMTTMTTKKHHNLSFAELINLLLESTLSLVQSTQLSIQSTLSAIEFITSFYA